jgi:hypothetical protein
MSQERSEGLPRTAGTKHVYSDHPTMRSIPVTTESNSLKVFVILYLRSMIQRSSASPMDLRL